MAIKAASLIVEIGSDTRGALSGLRSVSQSISTFAQTAQGTLAGILGAQVFQTAINGLGQIAQSALDATISWERLGFTIESMTARELRNADASLTMNQAFERASDISKETLAWITKLAIRSPFPSETVAGVYRMQMSLGATSQEARILSEALLNVAAATGMSEAEMERAGYALAQIRGSDKLLVQDLRQLINAGVDVNGILAKMGVKFSEVGEKAVSSSEFLKMFLSSSKDYGNAVDRMANSWAGLLGALADVRAIGLREFFGGTLSALRPLVQEFTDWVLGPGLPKLREWGDALGQMFANAVPKTRELVSGGLSLLRSAFSWLVENWPTISPALRGILAGLLAFSALAGIGTIIAGLTNPMMLLLTVSALLGVAWQNNFLNIRNITTKVFSVLLDWLWRIRGAIMIYLPQAIEYLRQIWDKNFLPPLQKVYEWLRAKILPQIQPLADAIGGFLVEAFRLAGMTLQNYLFPILLRLWQELSTRLMPALRAVAGFFADALPKILIGLTKAFQVATILTRRFREELQKLRLPDWLTPGSPTPLEIGLKGISAQMGKIQAIQFAAPVPAMSGGQTTNITLNITAKTENHEKLAQTILSALKEAYQ